MLFASICSTIERDNMKCFGEGLYDEIRLMKLSHSVVEIGGSFKGKSAIRVLCSSMVGYLMRASFLRNDLFTDLQYVLYPKTNL